MRQSTDDREELGGPHVQATRTHPSWLHNTHAHAHVWGHRPPRTKPNSLPRDEPGHVRAVPTPHAPANQTHVHPALQFVQRRTKNAGQSGLFGYVKSFLPTILGGGEDDDDEPAEAPAQGVVASPQPAAAAVPQVRALGLRCCFAAAAEWCCARCCCCSLGIQSIQSRLITEFCGLVHHPWGPGATQPGDQLGGGAGVFATQPPIRPPPTHTQPPPPPPPPRSLPACAACLPKCCLRVAVGL